jgi:hypothetical protein
MNKKVINAKKIGENPQQNGFSSSFSKTSLWKINKILPFTSTLGWHSKGAFTLGVGDSSVESPNTVLVI